MYNLYAQFPKQQVTKDRQYAALLRWAAFIAAQPIPAQKPEEPFVEQRLVAEKVPQQTDMFVTATISYVLQDPGIQTNIRQHLNSFNDEATEAAMDAQVDSAMAVAMPQFCHAYIGPPEIDAWYLENGFVDSPPMMRMTPPSRPPRPL